MTYNISQESLKSPETKLRNHFTLNCNPIPGGFGHVQCEYGRGKRGSIFISRDDIELVNPSDGQVGHSDDGGGRIQLLKVVLNVFANMYVCERKRIFVVQINFIAQNKAGNIQKSLKNLNCIFTKKCQGWIKKN